MRIVNPEVVNTINARKPNKWKPVADALRSGMAVQFTQDEVASFESFEASLRGSLRNMGLRVSIRRDRDTGDVYVLNKEPDAPLAAADPAPFG